MSAATAERTSSAVRRPEPEAAGGVVWREGDGTPELLLVFREAHSDWSFPKGHREDGETLAEAARREVAEETGVTPIVLWDVGSFSYPSESPHKKTVAMFHMISTDAERTALASDVTFAAWVPLDVAAKLLTHPEQRQFLEGLQPPSLRARSESGSRLLASLASPERVRLATEAEVLRSKLVPVAASPRALVDRAAREARSGDIDAGWKLLHEARRRSFDNLDEKTMTAEAIALEQEATAKLQGWRREAVVTLAKLARETNELAEKRSALVVATRIRDEQSDNVYFGNRLLRKQMMPIGIVLFVSLVGFAATRTEVIAPMLLGAAGACLSALITFARSTTRLKIPYHLANVLVTLMRPLIGAASGLVAYLFVGSGIFKEPAHLLYLSFAFGFSERLVLAAVDSAEKKNA